MSKTKPIGWITASALLCVAGVSIACRLNDGAGNQARAGEPVVKADKAPTPPPPPPSATGDLEEPDIVITTDLIPSDENSTPGPDLKKKRKPMPEPMDVPPPPGTGIAPPPPPADPLPSSTPPPPRVKEETGRDEPDITINLVPAPVAPPAPGAPEPLPGVDITAPPAPVPPPSSRDITDPPAPAPPVDVTKEPKPTQAPPVPLDTEPVDPAPPVKVELIPAPTAPQRPRVMEEVTRTDPKVMEKLSRDDEPKPPMADAPWKGAPSRPKDEAYIPAPAAPKVHVRVEPQDRKTGPSYRVNDRGVTLKDVAEMTLGSKDRWEEIKRLNPGLKMQMVVPYGTKLRLPQGAQVDVRRPMQEAPGGQGESELFNKAVTPRYEGRVPVSHLPIVRAAPVVEKDDKRAPLTGAFPCRLNKDGTVTLPEGMKTQLKRLSKTILVTPGPDHCLWVSTQDCTKCVLARVEKSYVNDDVVRAFRRLYFAQSEKTSINQAGQITIDQKLAQYAGLGTDLIVIGMEDHFELWDAQRWYQYSLKKTSEAKPYGKNRTVIRK